MDRGLLDERFEFETGIRVTTGGREMVVCTIMEEVNRRCVPSPPPSRPKHPPGISQACSTPPRWGPQSPPGDTRAPQGTGVTGVCGTRVGLTPRQFRLRREQVGAGREDRATQPQPHDAIAEGPPLCLPLSYGGLGSRPTHPPHPPTHRVPLIYRSGLSSPSHTPFLSLGRWCQRSPRAVPVSLRRVHTEGAGGHMGPDQPRPTPPPPPLGPSAPARVPLGPWGVDGGATW